MLQHAAAIGGGWRRVLLADKIVADHRVRLKLGVALRVGKPGFVHIDEMGGVVVSGGIGCRLSTSAASTTMCLMATYFMATSFR